MPQKPRWPWIVGVLAIVLAGVVAEGHASVGQAGAGASGYLPLTATFEPPPVLAPMVVPPELTFPSFVPPSFDIPPLLLPPSIPADLFTLPSFPPAATDPKAAGATAVCADGTWSFSAHRGGTCSYHGGVHWWTGNLGPAGPGGN